MLNILLLINYYFKLRFLRDGYRTELEDASRTYYDMHETRNFQDIECQFPFFFAFLCITG